MDASQVLADVQLALSLGNMAVQLGEEAAPFLLNAYNIAFNNKVLTDDERAVMQSQEAAMRTRVDAAIAADALATD